MANHIAERLRYTIPEKELIIHRIDHLVGAYFQLVLEGVSRSGSVQQRILDIPHVLAVIYAEEFHCVVEVLGNDNRLANLIRCIL